LYTLKIPFGRALWEGGAGAGGATVLTKTTRWSRQWSNLFDEAPPGAGATCSMRLLQELAVQLELEPHRTPPKPVQQL